MHTQSTILIVDDDPIGRETLDALLTGQGYHIVFATSGAEALQQAPGITPDLILLDVMMPGMDGFEVCRRLRTHPMLSEVPVIMVTALDDQASRLQGIEAGADDFISKPFNRTELRARVHTIIRLNRYRRLLAERDRFQRLIELSPDGILIVNTAGSIHLANPAMARMMHASDRDELIGHNILSFIPAEYLDHCQHCLASTLSGDSEGICLDIVWKRRDGTTVPVEIHAGRLEWDDQPSVQIIARDITERKEAEEEHIHLVQKLAEREHRLQDLVEKLIVSQEEERRRIAYELHDGLAQVATSTHQHLQTFATLHYPTNPQAAHELDKIVKLTQKVVKEARQIIAGMRPTVLDDFGLSSALRQEIETLRAAGWSITYEESTCPERLPTVVETAFYRIAQEALTNIRKHAGPTRVRVKLYYDDQVVRLEVQDWGCGFDTMADQATDSPGEQIGLMGMEERINVLGGTFSLFSQPGQGTLVVAEAPLPEPTQPPTHETTAETPVAPPLPDRARVIIADDHELSRAGIRSMLAGEREMELVGEASTGREALDLCQLLHPDLALLDVRMPEMDGLQATRAIKEACPDVSVIIVTMHEDADYLLAAIRAGAAGYLLKDTGRRELLAAVRRVLRGESFLNTELTQRLLQRMASEKQPATEEPLPEPLTPREHDVLHLMAQGKTNREIASNLVISPLTVKVHVQHIIAKLNVSDRTQAAVRATELGLLKP